MFANRFFSFIASYTYVGMKLSNSSNASSSRSLPFALGSLLGVGESGTNSLRNRMVASTSGVAFVPSRWEPTTGPATCFRSSEKKRWKGGQYTRICRTAFAKHILPVLMSPRGRIFMAAATLTADPEGPSLSRRNSSLRFADPTDALVVADGDPPAVAGMENPTTLDTGRRDLEDDALESDGCRSEAQDRFGPGSDFAEAAGAADVDAAAAGALSATG